MGPEPACARRRWRQRVRSQVAEATLKLFRSFTSFRGFAAWRPRRARRTVVDEQFGDDPDFHTVEDAAESGANVRGGPRAPHHPHPHLHPHPPHPDRQGRSTRSRGSKRRRSRRRHATSCSSTPAQRACANPRSRCCNRCRMMCRRRVHPGHRAALDLGKQLTSCTSGWTPFGAAITAQMARRALAGGHQGSQLWRPSRKKRRRVDRDAGHADALAAQEGCRWVGDAPEAERGTYLQRAAAAEAPFKPNVSSSGPRATVVAISRRRADAFQLPYAAGRACRRLLPPSAPTRDARPPPSAAAANVGEPLPAPVRLRRVANGTCIRDSTSDDA